MASISSFNPLTDQWSSPMTINGSPYAIESANVNGNAPWSVTQLDGDTLRFSLKPSDLWENDSHRSEIVGETLYAPTDTVNIAYTMTVQPGVVDPNLDWLILGQMHADESTAAVQALTADYPIYALHLTGPNGVGTGDYLAIEAFYLPAGSDTPVDVPGSNARGYIYVSPQPIVRGQPYSIQIQASFQNNANGFLKVSVNGSQVVDYKGAIGYGVANYWKEGVYEGYDPTQSISVDFANTNITTGAGGSTPTSVSAPVITAWSPDTGTVGDGITNAAALTLTGSAAAGSTVGVYDGATKLGSVGASSTGAWSFTTAALANGAHKFTAIDTVAGQSSVASNAIAVTVDTVAPTAPSVKSSAVVNANQVTITGAAEANATIKLYDGTTGLLSVKASSTGAWSATTGALASGAHAFRVTATDAAGNTSAGSSFSASIASGSTGGTTSGAIVFKNLTEFSNGFIFLKGAADPNSKVGIYEGTTQLATTTADASGSWYTVTRGMSDTIHSFTASEVSSSGTVLASTSGKAILGTTGADVLRSTSGDDVFFGQKSQDSFVFGAGFGHDVLIDGGAGDKFQFAKSEFSSFSALLSHAVQAGADTVITNANDSLTMKNTQLTSLSASQFRFV